MATKPNINKFLRLKKKVHCLKLDIFFLKQYKNEKVFPSFMKFKNVITNSRQEDAIQAGKRKWLCNERKYIHAKLQNIELELYNLHLLITKSITTENDFVNWLQYKLSVEKTVIKLIASKKEKLDNKLKKFNCRQKLQRTGKTSNKVCRQLHT